MRVTVLRFRAGQGVFALAAGAVASIGAVRADIPHLSWVLERQLPELTTGSRALQVVDRSQRVEVVVDGPVEVIELAVDDIAPCRTTTSATIMGFARRDDGVVALLDAARLVELVRDAMPQEVA